MIKANKTSVIALFVLLALWAGAFVYWPLAHGVFLPAWGTIILLLAGGVRLDLLVLGTGLASVVALGVLFKGTIPDRVFLFLGLGQVWAVWILLQATHHRSAGGRRFTDRETAFWTKRRDALEKDLTYYHRRADDLRAKAHHQQKLSACARDLGSGLDAAKIQLQLLRWTKEFFPDAKHFLQGLNPNDPLDTWILQHQQAHLCEDILRHEKFKSARREPDTRCLLSAPLWVEGKMFGTLRVESPSPDSFHLEDVRLLSALTTLASLSLDNTLLYSRVEAAALRDSLTGLYTHRAFQEHLEEELLRAGRYHTPVSLAMLDVDHFKLVNDTQGHAAGDEVLKRLAQRLRDAVRPVDIVARYGGEEFVLLLLETDKAAAAALLENLRQRFSAEQFQGTAGPFHVTFSLGLAVYAAEATTAPQLVRLADQRLYKAKQSGRDRLVMEG